jgi:putative addiction module CopG family antidote
METTMVLTLTPKQLEFVRLKVESGSYANATEVVEDALALLDRRDRQRALEQSILEADASIDRGEGIEWTPELMDQIWREADELVQSGNFTPDPDVWP